MKSFLSVTSAFSLGLFLSMGINASALDIVGHRGASYDAPENSLTSMKLAWKQNADGIETDIYLSKDNKIVVMHDADTKRTGGVDKKIIDQTWDELKNIDIGKWKDEKFAGEKIPTLDSFFATIPTGKYIFTEIKIHDTALLPELEKAMKASGKSDDQLRFITFHYDMAKATKEKFPKNEVYWLAGYGKDKKTGKLPDIDDLIKKAKKAKLDGLDLNSGFPIDKAFVKKVHAAGLKLYTWTVDDVNVAKAEKEAGVDGITTNRPEYLREQLFPKAL